MMDGGIFLGGKHTKNSGTVLLFAVSNIVSKYYYPCNIAYSSYQLTAASPHTRTDMPIAAPVILAFWSDEE